VVVRATGKFFDRSLEDLPLLDPEFSRRFAALSENEKELILQALQKLTGMLGDPPCIPETSMQVRANGNEIETMRA
jgi:hypothetical protein